MDCVHLIHSSYYVTELANWSTRIVSSRFTGGNLALDNELQSSDQYQLTILILQSPLVAIYHSRSLVLHLFFISRAINPTSNLPNPAASCPL